MKVSISICICLLLFISNIHSQSKTIIINPLQQKTEELYRNIYKYPKFIEGKIVYTDSSISEGLFNYHKILNQILFIGSNADTLAFAHPEICRFIIAGQDTFLFYRKGFLQKLTHNPVINLFVSEIIKYIGWEKKGAYGTYSTLYSANSNSTMATDNQINQYLELDENLIFKSNFEFFLSDKFNNIYPANKKGFYNFYSRKESELTQFLKAKSIDFHKQSDLELLLNYMNSL